MAKGKHATALFEVIHGDHRFNRRHPTTASALRTPKWWFKGKKQDETPAAERSRTSEPATHAAEAAPAPKPAPAPEPMVERQAAPIPIASIEPAPISTELATASPPEVHPVAADLITPLGATALKVDKNHQQILFRLSYTTAITTAFAVLVIVGLAYVLGRQVATGPRPLLGASTQELLDAPAQPGVIDIPRDPLAKAMPARDKTSPSNANSATSSNQTTPNAQTQQKWNEPKPPATYQEDNAKRTIGLNYVIVQTYAEKAEAQAACDLLIKNNILCTVENGPASWARMDWYSVVGIRGFDKVLSAREYDDYVAKIQAVGGKQEGSAKKFDPHAFKWR